MRYKFRILFFTALFCAAVPAKAEPPVHYFCSALPLLATKVQDCSENQLFSQAANACLQKLENQIQAENLMLSQAMLLNSTAAASAQSGRMENNSKNINALQLSMQKLIEEARHARREIVSYSENFVYAGPISKENAERLHMVKFLRSFNCHSEPLGELVKVVGKLDQKVAEMQKVTKAALTLEATTAANIKKIDASSVTQSASNRSPASSSGPAAGGPKPASRQGPSTITGEVGKSDRALQKLSK